MNPALLLLSATLCVAPVLPPPTSVAAAADEQHVSPCAELKRADAELKALYKQVVVGYAQRKVFLVKLRESQKAWLKYRDAQLELVFPERNKAAAYGPSFATCACQVLSGLTQARAEHLRQWFTGVSSTEVCPGSIRVNPAPSAGAAPSPSMPPGHVPVPGAVTLPPSRPASSTGPAPPRAAPSPSSAPGIPPVPPKPAPSTATPRLPDAGTPRPDAGRG